MRAHLLWDRITTSKMASITENNKSKHYSVLIPVATVSTIILLTIFCYDTEIPDTLYILIQILRVSQFLLPRTGIPPYSFSQNILTLPYSYFSTRV